MEGAVMNERIYMLCDLEVDEKGRVTDIFTRGDMRRRFMDLGLIGGTEVTCLLKTHKGDISAYLVRGTVIAIRSEDVREIFIKKLRE